MNRKSWSTVFGTVLILSAAACGGADDANTEAEAPAAEAPAATTAETPAATPPAASGGALPAGVTQEMVAAGQAQWSGGAPCLACHGPDANGTVLAPSLRDAEWLNSVGSYEGIVKTINEGVAQPKKFSAAMPAKGGAALTDQQVNELAAYVYSISHGG